MAGKRTAILLAAERSGTHLLRSILNSSGVAFAPGEPANAGADRRAEPSPTDFFKIRHEFIGRRSGYWVPTVSATNELISHFFDTCEGVASPGKIFVCDVKYGHVHNFNAGWWDFFSVPTLISYAAANDIPIIHLIRRFPAETTISGLYAHQTGVWRAWSAEGLKEIQISVERQRLQADTNRLVATISQFSAWLRGVQHLEMYYDELLTKDSQSWKNWESISGTKVDQMAPKVLKTTPEYQKAIRNFGEVEDLLQIKLSDWGVINGKN